MANPPLERQDPGQSSRTARLLRQYHRNGDTRARDHLIEVYLPLVQSFARRYSRGADDYEDLYQVGCIGLIKAIDRFEFDRGDELAAFAVPNIAGEIRRYLRDRAGSVRLPRPVLELHRRAVQARRELEAGLGRAPTNAEIARKLGVDDEEVALALDAPQAAQAHELGDELAEGPGPIDAAEDRVFLAEAFRGLDDADRRILYLRYVRDLQPADVARELGLTPRQLSRRTNSALERLRAELERSGPAPDRVAEAPKLKRDAARKPKMAQMAATKALDPRYLEQPYHIELVRDEGPGGGWTARVEELVDCVGRGATSEEAVAAVEVAMHDWIAAAVAGGREVPKPRSPGTHSGRLLVRMPQSLHAELARAAEREEVSLNQFITGVLSASIGWRSQSAAASGSDPGRRRVLIANLVVLAIVALAALALLVVELVQKL